MTASGDTLAEIAGAPCSAHFRELVGTLAGVVAELGPRAGQDEAARQAARTGYAAVMACPACRESWQRMQRLQALLGAPSVLVPAGRG